MKKKSICLLLLLCVCLAFSSCVYIYIDRQIENYGEFRDSRYCLFSCFDMFPDDIADTWNVDDYYFWWRETLLYDDAIVYLNISFSDEEYEAELNRIKNEKYTWFNNASPVVDQQNFNYTAYVFTYATKRYEYALIIPEENRIVYVFLQTAPERKCKLLGDYLPKEYFVGYQEDVCYDAQ